MARKSDVILLGILVGLFLVVANWPYLYHYFSAVTGAITGNSIKEVIGTFYETSSISQRIFILSQIILLIIIVVAVFIIAKRVSSKGNLTKKDYITTGENRRSRTDLDVLYEMLKKRKEIRMESVEQAFRVKPGIALEWFKVLENGELAEINYPRFGKPMLSLPERDERIKERTANKKDKKTKVIIEGIDIKKAVRRKNVINKKSKFKGKVVKKRSKFKGNVVKKRSKVKGKVVKKRSKVKGKVVKKKATKRKR